MGRSKVRLGAALYNAHHAHLGDELRRVEDAGLDFVHLDVFDGHFVPDLGFPPRTIAALRPLSRLPFEVHLGVLNPLEVLPHLAEAGVDSVLVHIESIRLSFEGLFAMREYDMRVGVALALGTPMTCLEPVIGLVDAVLLLSRVTGEGARGATFSPLVLSRVAQARRMCDEVGSSVDIEVAGGVNRHHVIELMAAGATALGMGAGIYSAPDMAREVEKLRALLDREE